MHEGERLPYVTIGFMTLAPKQSTDVLQSISDRNAAQMLRQAMMKTLLDLRMTVPRGEPGTLYWRYAAGGRFLEEIETSNRKRYAKIMTRIAVPNTDYGVQGVTAQGERYPQI
jgi:hypothetical protein